MSFSKTIALLAVLALFVSACTTEQKKAEMDQTVKAQPTANSPEQIAQRAAESFANAPGLTADQKQKLMGIYAKTYGEATAIRTELGQSKSLLFKLVADSKTKSSEVNLLKKKITNLDQKRLALMFQALDEVQAVVGYGSDRDEIYKHLRDFEYPHPDNL
jgi:PBP1b-binding outer membrane lipoprotein LpoB